MKDVNDLNKTETKESVDSIPQTQPTISLSAVMNKENNTVNINTIGELSGIPEGAGPADPPAQPLININPRRKSHHRSTVDSEDVKQVNPNDFIPPAPKPKTETLQDKAISLLAEDVEKRKKEFHQFVEEAIEEDKINREKVENGLETVGEEIQYLPNELHVPMNENEKVKPIDQEVKDDNEELHDIISSSLPVEEEFTYEEADNLEDMEIENSNVAVQNPFQVLEEEKKETVPVVNEEEIKEEVIEPVVSTAKEPSEESDGYEQILSNSINITTSALNSPIANASSADFETSDEDFDEISEDNTVSTEDGELSTDEILKISEASEKRLKAEILQKVIQAGKKMDTTQFIVSNKVINLKDAFRNIPKEEKVERTAIWPLTFAGRPFKASALKGPEVAMLADSDNSESNRSVGLTLEQAKILFEHDANPYRPSTLEKWAKTIPFVDIENIFAALYIASLKGANYIPMACSKTSCQYAYLSENISVDKLVKFNTDEVKQRFEEIKKMEITAENTGSYESVVNVINDRFAVGIKIPSIFTMLYEYGPILGTEFFNKYRTMISVIQYIDYIYYIDSETSQFQPIGWKTYPGDYQKSFKSKIATYGKILKEFDDTDFTVLLALINSLVNKIVDARAISFEIPEDKCPKCGTTIEARPINARGLVFVRQRLVELATIRSER